MGVTLFYLGGVYLAVLAVFPAAYTIILCALLLGFAALRLARRKGAFLFVCGIFLFLGNLNAGRVLTLRDTPTGTGAHIVGTVAAIEREHRVFLSDVTVNGERMLLRDAVVTLMPPKEEEKPIAETPRVGQRVEGTGRLFAPDEPRNPGGTNWRYRALADGYELSGYLQDGWKAEGEERFSVREALRGLRTVLLAHVERIFGERAALFQGIMLGDRSSLDQELTRALQLTGTAHILTVSGLHLSMMAAAASALLDRTVLRRRSRFAVLGAFLAVFTGLTGWAAGTVRAMIMALLRELARVRGKRYEPLTGLSCAALIMTAVNPTWALDASFQFSFFVVLGIVLLCGGIAEMRNRRGQTLSRVRSAARMLFSAVGVSLCAQISALPMQLLLYGYVPLLSLPMNALCGLLMPLMMLGGWISTFAGMLSVRLGILAAQIAVIPAALFERVSLRAVQFPYAIARFPAPYPVGVFLFAMLLMLLSRRIRFGSLRRKTVLIAAAAVVLVYLPRFDPSARYVQLDVGQGDASLLRDGRKAVVVDVGPADSYDMLRYLRHEGLFVEAVVLSHLDQDHAGALGTLLDSELEIPAVVMPVGARDVKLSDPVKQALGRIEEKNIGIYDMRRGDLLTAGRMNMQALLPEKAGDGGNESSLVLQAQLEGVSILLTGDLPIRQEPDSLPACDVLKAAHHGSKSSTSAALLDKVKPKLALISVGADNWYGHPSREVLVRLEDAQVQTLRTDERGCITLRLRNGEIQAECFLPDKADGS